MKSMLVFMVPTLTLGDFVVNGYKKAGADIIGQGAPGMRYHVSLTGDGDGYVAECADLSLMVRSLSPSNALDRLRDEIRYRVELCPCTSVNEDDIELVVER